MNFENQSRCRAFTLIEIMVAIAIFGMIVAAIYSTWTFILRASRTGLENAAQVQRERIAVRTIEDSLTCIQSFQASLQYYYFVVQKGDNSMLSFTARVPEIFPRNGRFGDFNLRRLVFTVEPGPDSTGSEKDLVLRQNPILMDMDEDEQHYPLVLARNVEDFVVECWDTNTMQWDDEWVVNTNSIPPMVRVSLLLGGNADSGSAANLAVIRLVALPSIMMPAVVQMPTGGGGNNRNNNLNINNLNNNQNNQNNNQNNRKNNFQMGR